MSGPEGSGWTRILVGASLEVWRSPEGDCEAWPSSSTAGLWVLARVFSGSRTTYDAVILGSFEECDAMARRVRVERVFSVARGPSRIF